MVSITEMEKKKGSENLIGHSTSCNLIAKCFWGNPICVKIIFAMLEFEDYNYVFRLTVLLHS